ncbi:hypothetical protein N7462_006821 [Penicillium macrosclerotiorum]|uniref:uncharacterized protein n=1 Tax=Penicillium macrosclerotiorum TaxID=303699 RepID=UPI002548093E|nr:uncharacterized protein N7462_006821 [Penicillium macrosclerotiorum]KAJ5678577.1 hypothetical protein N7462_006821 [Penicillium macrosclerotiorum]
MGSTFQSRGPPYQCTRKPHTIPPSTILAPHSIRAPKRPPSSDDPKFSMLP